MILILNSPVIQGIVTLLTLLTIASVTWFVIRLIQFLVDGAHLPVGGAHSMASLGPGSYTKTIEPEFGVHTMPKLPFLQESERMNVVAVAGSFLAPPNW